LISFEIFICTAGIMMYESSANLSVARCNGFQICCVDDVCGWSYDGSLYDAIGLTVILCGVTKRSISERKFGQTLL